MFWLILDVEGGRGGRHWEFPEWIGPDLESRRELLRIFRSNQRCHLVDQALSLKPYLGETCGRLATAGPLAEARLAAAVNHLLLSVARLLAGDGGGRHEDPHGFDRTVHGFFRGLEASPECAAEPWTVASMARACRVGATYLTRACKELFNATPSDHLVHVRLAHAAKMLRDDPARPVTDVAFATGFNSSQHFATRFRRQFGTTPGAFRKQISPE
jgi:AraC family L-rhamnose operon regulatory protein RhaS